MEISVALLATVVSVAFAVYFGTKNQKRSDNKDTADQAANQARIETKLDNINTCLQDIRYDISALKKDTQQHNERLILVENKANRAHERIDELK